MHEPGELLVTGIGVEGCDLDFLDYGKAVEGVRKYEDFTDGTTVMFLGFTSFIFTERNRYWKTPIDLRIAKFLIGEKVYFWRMDRDRETQMRNHLSRLQEDAQPQVQSP